MLKLGQVVPDISNLESLEDAIDSANRLLWYITIDERGEYWCVCSGLGEAVLLVTDNREAAEAFIYGMGLAYSVIPEDITRDYLSGLGLELESNEYIEDYLRRRQQMKEDGGN